MKDSFGTVYCLPATGRSETKYLVGWRKFCILTWKSLKGPEANSADPDQTPHNVASDQDLHCLLTGFSIKNKINVTK